jgi:hypothetical protein
VLEDLRRLSLIDCRAPQGTLAAKRRVRAQGRRLVVAPGERARRFFTLAGAAQQLQLAWDP